MGIDAGRGGEGLATRNRSGAAMARRIIAMSVGGERRAGCLQDQRRERIEVGRFRFDDLVSTGIILW